MKKANKFISKIKILDDSIVVDYNDNSQKIVPYDYDTYLNLLIDRHNSLENFNIEDIKNEIFEGRIRRVVLLSLITSGCIFMNFDLLYFIVTFLMFLANEFGMILNKKEKRTFEKAVLLDICEPALNHDAKDNENIQKLVDKKCNGKNNATINELSLRDLNHLKRKLIEENIIESQKNKVMRKTKK